MESSISAVAAQVIAIYQESITANMVGIAVAALLLHDVILTSGQEYRYIWQLSKSWFSRILYVWNRYMYLLATILGLGAISPISNLTCASLGWLITVLQILNLVGPAMFTTLRIYALSKKNRLLGGVALVLSMVPFFINTSAAYQSVPINLPAPLNCQSYSTASTSLDIGLTVASRSCLILVDSLAVVVTWRQTRAAIRLRTDTLKRPSLEQVMWENGTLYFLTLVSMNAVDMSLVILSIAVPPEHQSSYVVGFVDPISSILNSRFLLALHETNARLEGAAGDTDTAVSVSSLCFNPRSGGTAGTPTRSQLPDFLGIIGGPVHSFHHADDLESLDIVPLPQRQSAPQSGLGGEVPESGGDPGGNAAV